MRALPAGFSNAYIALGDQLVVSRNAAADCFAERKSVA